MRQALWSGLGAAIWGAAAGLAVSRATVTVGVVAAVVGSALGVLAGYLLARSRLRLPLIWLGGAAVLWLLHGTVALGLRFTVLPRLLGAGRAYACSELVLWLGTGLVVVGVLEASSRRVPTLLALEMLVLGAVLASPLAAHRDGFINRPFAVVDELWSRGWDPLPFFVGIGVAVAAALVLLAAHTSSRRRSSLDLAVLVGLLVTLFLLLPIARLKDLPPFLKGGSGQQQTEGQQGGRGSGSSASKGDREDRVDAMASFSNQSVRPTNQPVAVVVLHDDHDPPEGYFYLRQTAFSQFNGVRLVQDTSGQADTDLVESFPTARIGIPAETDRTGLFGELETTVALMAPHPRPFALINPLELTPTPNPDAVRFLRAYRVTSRVLERPLPELAGLAVGSEAWSRPVWRHYTEGSADPRFAALASEAVALLKPEYRQDRFSQAVAIQYWLGQNSVYSLTSSHDQSPDPVADFLFGDRTGHCVFLAHSACLLFRARGIPARVGAGYAVDARNRGGGSAVLVRARDAHAWPEIYLEGGGWVAMDIAPARSLVPPEEAPDQGLQQMLGEMARGQGVTPPVEEPPPAEGNLQEAVRRGLRSVAGMALPGLAAALAALYAVKLWRRVAVRVCRERALPRVAYRAALDRLAETGRWREPGQPREAFARTLAAPVPALARLTELHVASVLRRQPYPAPRSEYLDLDRRVAAEVAASARPGRRLVGAFDPFAWMRVH